MIDVYRPDARDNKGVDIESALDLIGDIHDPIWIDITAPTDDELATLAKRLGLHVLAVEDVKQGRQRPKVSQYRDHLFVVVHERPAPDPDQPEKALEGRAEDIYMFVGSRFFVSIHAKPSPIIVESIERWRSSDELTHKGELVQLYLVLDCVIDLYISLLDVVNDEIADIEERVVAPAGDEDYRGQRQEEARGLIDMLLTLRRSLLEMRRSVGHLRDAVNVLLRKVESLADDSAHPKAATSRECFAYYQDIYDHAMRITDTLDTYRDILGGVLDAHLAMSSNRLNEVVKVLTSVSIILMSLAMISGIYGMNFVYMPELHWKYGYAYSIGLMVLVSLGLFAYFRKRRWI